MPLNTSDLSPDLASDDLEATVLATEDRRRELAREVAAARRKADVAKERAREAQEKFERLVALLASSKPQSQDWFAHPGVLSRSQLVESGKLNTVQLHRIMKRFQERGDERDS